MNHKRTFITLWGFVAITFQITQSKVFADDPTFPKLFFSYSRLYDGACATKENPINEDWAKEALERESEFSSIWEKDGPTLLGQVIKDFGKGFSRHELTATLSVCNHKNASSYSNPLVLNVVKFLKSYWGDKDPWKDYAFVDLVFHELLHTWVVENVDIPTPLQTKYQDEGNIVLAHLHLMAIQKLVYTELDKKDMLDWISWKYPKMADLAYGRAWTIVNEIEGYEAFIEEMKEK